MEPPGRANARPRWLMRATRSSRAATKLPNDRKVIWAVQSRREKFPASVATQITSVCLTSRALQEGRFAIVTDVGQGMRWTRAASSRVLRADERRSCGRRSRVVLTPRRWRQVLEKQASWGRWWQTSPVTRESAKETVKPPRREGRVFRRTCSRPPCAFYLLHTGLRVLRAPGLPRALVRVAKIFCKTRAHRAARTRRHIPSSLPRRRGPSIPRKQ
jgi:hypothetical protein